MKSNMIIILLITLVVPNSNAQNVSFVSNNKTLDSSVLNFGKADTLVLMGKIQNAKKTFLTFGITSFNNTSSVLEDSVSINQDGTFFRKLPIVHRQKITIYVDDNYWRPFYVSGGDTLILNWDERNPKMSFVARSPNLFQDTVLQIQNKYFETIAEQQKKVKTFVSKLETKHMRKDTLTDKALFDSLNKYYNESVHNILLEEKRIGKKSRRLVDVFGNLLQSNYYDCINYFNENFPTLSYLYTYYVEDCIMKKIPKDSAYVGKKNVVYYRYRISPNRNAKYADYKQENYFYFTDIPEYRAFLLQYLRMSHLIYAYIGSKDGSKEDKFTNISYGVGYNITSTVMRDWYLSNILQVGFEHWNYDNVFPIYERFINYDCKTPYFKNSIVEYNNSISKLKAGTIAPSFTLRDENGKNISLQDFRGKIVYIDFWGIGCGPCIADIENHQKEFHEKYAGKGVVFLNICVDADSEKEWKDGLEKHKVEGVNLWAKGWTDNQVCKDYGVNGIPHYYLVDKTGKIVDNNAERMQSLVSLENNAIDKLLVLDF